MNRETALEHFNEQYVKNIGNEKYNELKAYYEKNKGQLALHFVECFKEMCLKIKDMQHAGEKGEIGHINFSMLRTDMLEKNYVYRAEAYNKYWFHDTSECRILYDVTWCFRFLDNFISELTEKRKLYINKIIQPDIERIMLRELTKYNEYIVEIARYAMPEAVKAPEFLEVRRESVFSIRVGEYKGKYDVVYVIDDREKDSREVRNWLEMKSEYGYENEVLRGLDLSKGDYDALDLRYADFSRSNLSGSSMKRCLLKGVVFENANLENTDFQCSDLTSAIFRNVVLNHTNFKGAVLNGAVFSKDAYSSAHLDEQQQTGIIIEP
ncbi:MAG: pentapeptide repeat-containing protein [Clostridia bacterium]|nr:pentapeptide repeat-containing protein [Clostridia bacterium]